MPDAIHTPMHIRLPFVSALLAVTAFAAGCASTGSQDAGTAAGKATGTSSFKASDGRIITVGKAAPENGGRSFRNPHLEKCWIADGFNFTGYDTLYIAPVASTAKFKDDEAGSHQLAQERLVSELAALIKAKGIYQNVVTKESEIPPSGRTLRLDNTITEYKTGGGAARYFAGVYGAGQPVLTVMGSLKDGTREVFSYQARRSGVSGSARVFGGFKSDEDIQLKDIRSMVLDLTDFMAAVAGKYEAR
jgi:hypothetical protein